MKITCEALVEHLSAYLDDELDDELSQAAEEHLATCENCKVVLDSTQRTILLYKKQGTVVRIPAERKEALYDQIMAAFSTSSDE